MRIYVYVYICTCVYVCVYMYVCIYVCVYMYVCLCVSLCLYVSGRFALCSCYYRHYQADDSPHHAEEANAAVPLAGSRESLSWLSTGLGIALPRLAVHECCDSELLTDGVQHCSAAGSLLAALTCRAPILLPLSDHLAGLKIAPTDRLFLPSVSQLMRAMTARNEPV